MSKPSDKTVTRGASLGSLSKSLSEFLSRETLREGLLADLFDIQGICFLYLEAINDISKRKLTAEEFEEFLGILDIELLEHLQFHIRSLKKVLPKAKRDMKKARAARVGRISKG